MTIQEVVQELKKEKQNNVPSRFPCRAIMVSNIEQYCQLLSELKKISDTRVINSSEIFTSPDVLPKYEMLKADTLSNEWVILTGVSEYLRLFSKKEATDRRFASLWGYQRAASSVGRILIPLWGCEAQWFDDALNLSGDLRQQDFYYNCTASSDLEPEMSLIVLSGQFEKHISKISSIRANACITLQEWFKYWEAPNPDGHDFLLLTNRCNSITNVSGKISIHVIKNVLSFVRENMPGADILNNENCSVDMQNLLFDYALDGTDIRTAILKLLNLSTFNGLDIMSRWANLTDAYQELVALWMKMYPTNDYLGHCFAISKSIKDVPAIIEHEIFHVRGERPEWVAQYRELAGGMGLEPDEDFFHSVDDIPEYEVRLDFLTNHTRKERIYLLKMVGLWMRKDLPQVQNSKKLRSVYPELSVYLSQNIDALKSEMGDYLSAYKAYKLSNTLPQDEELYFNGIQTDSFANRYAVLSDYINDSTVVLWIDALGAEWLSLLYWSIKKDCDCSFQTVQLAQATLPTETCYNDQWHDMEVPHVKKDKLDKLAHKGVIDEPDYYSCVEEQISFVKSISQFVQELMKQYHRVIITGDHGTSRLAARFFHLKEGSTAPSNSKVGSHGRFCELADDTGIVGSNLKIKKGKDGAKYAVFCNYDHYKQSGFAAGGDDDNAIFGEIHGGASPEEMMVPVVVVDSNHELPLAATWNKTTVKISMRKARLGIKFNKPVASLIMKIGDNLGTTEKLGDGAAWNVVFPNIKDGDYQVEVIANGNLISMPNVTIKPALSGGSGDLP